MKKAKVKLTHANFSLFLKVKIEELEKMHSKDYTQFMNNIEIHLHQLFMVV